MKEEVMNGSNTGLTRSSRNPKAALIAVLATLLLMAPAAHGWDGFFDVNFNYTGSSWNDDRFSGHIE